jgi:hypothetical protein
MASLMLQKQRKDKNPLLQKKKKYSCRPKIEMEISFSFRLNCNFSPPFNQFMDFGPLLINS